MTGPKETTLKAVALLRAREQEVYEMATAMGRHYGDGSAEAHPHYELWCEIGDIADGMEKLAQSLPDDLAEVVT